MCHQLQLALICTIGISCLTNYILTWELINNGLLPNLTLANGLGRTSLLHFCSFVATNTVIRCGTYMYAYMCV